MIDHAGLQESDDLDEVEIEYYDPPVLATYDDKIEHVQLVAERGVEARTLTDDAGLRCSRRRARAVFRAMAIEVQCLQPFKHILVLSDTPMDRPYGKEGGVSRAWAKHVEKVFVSSFVAGIPKPAPPVG